MDLTREYSLLLHPTLLSVIGVATGADPHSVVGIAQNRRKFFKGVVCQCVPLPYTGTLATPKVFGLGFLTMPILNKIFFLPQRIRSMD